MLMSSENQSPQTKKTNSPAIDEIRHYPGYENAYYDEKGKLIKE